MSSIVQDAVAGLGRSEGPADERPLTDEERRQVARLLSDPFAFPQTFKTWLVSFLESSDLTLPISSIAGLGSTLGIGGDGNTSFIQGLLPAGTIVGWSSARVPSGCLRCDGSAYSRTAYARLFKEIGTQWGAGDGATTFNVPDFRRRVPVGVGATAFALAGSDGLAESQRSIDHHHNIDRLTDNGGSHGHEVYGGTDWEGDHSHGYTLRGIIADNIYSSGDAQRSVVTTGDFVSTGGGGGHDHSISGWTSGSPEHQHRINGPTSGGFAQNHPAFVVIHFIITT